MAEPITWRGDYLQKLARARSFEDVREVFAGFCEAHRVPRASYHHLPPVGSAEGGPEIHAEGFPEEWVEEYVNERLFRHDPITRLALRRCQPFLWSEIERIERVSPAERDYLRRLRAAGVGDGIAIPVFGPGGRNGYFGIGLPEGAPPPGLREMREFQWACQLAHHRYCDILAAAAPQADPLSERETEVLGWIAEGKSNAETAVIAGLSEHTVDTFVRRIYGKLGVTDRVSAVLKGLKSGAISAYVVGGRAPGP
jgi:LuxR family transcriptional regulator/LuxR family quorum-sensing system transcriptional regulator CciR